MIVILGILAGIVVFAVGNMTSNAKTTGCNGGEDHDQRGVRVVQGPAPASYPTAAAAGGGRHKAMDLLTGNAATTPAVRQRS